MSFEQLQAKVARAEDTLEARERQIAADVRVFGGCWRDLWSPWRIVGTGMATGLLVGLARSGRTLGGAQPASWLQLLGSAAGLVGSVQAAFAASGAQEAADEAGDAAAMAATGIDPEAVSPTTAARAAAAAGTVASGAAAADRPTARVAAASMPPSARRHVPDPSWETPPRPAEAATEMSERR